jgi:hypothetical protein
MEGTFETKRNLDDRAQGHGEGDMGPGSQVHIQDLLPAPRGGPGRGSTPIIKTSLNCSVGSIGNEAIHKCRLPELSSYHSCSTIHRTIHC